MSNELNDAVALLRREGYRVEVPQKYPFYSCHVCGAVDEDLVCTPQHYEIPADLDPETLEIADWMTRIKVEIGESGEEGWDVIVHWYCDAHALDRIDELMNLGYITHHHGSTHPLADDDNCQYGCERQGSPYDE